MKGSPFGSASFSFYLNRSYLILYSPLCSLSQQFLDLGRYCLAVGTSCQALAGNTHHLAHFLSTGGANLGNNSAEFCFQFLGSESLGKVCLH